MYAVIKTGGKQYRVSEGDVITIEKLEAEDGAKIEFDKILLVEDNGNLMVGTPYLDAAKVIGSVIETGKGKKVIIFKYKAKKDYRKKQGHRQPYTMVKIETISDGSGKPAVKAAPVKEAPPAEEPVKEEAAAEVKKPAAKRTAKPKEATTEEAVAEVKKPAAKRTAKPKEDKPEAEKKPAAEKKTAAKKAPAKEE